MPIRGKYRVTVPLSNSFGRIFAPGECGSLDEVDGRWRLSNDEGQIITEPLRLFMGWISDGTLVKLTEDEQRRAEHVTARRMLGRHLTVWERATLYKLVNDERERVVKAHEDVERRLYMSAIDELLSKIGGDSDGRE